MDECEPLTAPAPDVLLAPPPALAGCVHHGLVKELPGGGYLLPAGLQPIFLVILSGTIRLDHDGRVRELPRVNLAGGTRGPRSAWAKPGTRILLASLRPGTLRRLVDLPALAVMEECPPLADLLGPAERGELARCEDRFAATDDPLAQAAHFFALLAALRARRADVAADLRVPVEWLADPSRALADRFGIGERQFERRFLASYGQPLRGFRRQMRCSRLLADFVCGRTRIESWAQLAAEAGFCDQSHLHHDVQRFTGHSPGRLAAGIAARDPAFWPYFVAPQAMARMFGPTGY